MSEKLQALADAGVSIWLDDLSRDRLETGNLADLISRQCVVGVTSNPSIFANALYQGERYDEQVRQLASAGTGVDDAVQALTTSDIREACDVLAPVHTRTGGVDGRVSLEVPPDLAYDTDETIAVARQLWQEVDRANLFIKIPATEAGLPAISATIAEGMSINVTLIFGLERYRQVMGAYVEGLEQARENGHDLSAIHSVASFFVSRVDAEVDKRLDAIGTDEAQQLRGRAAVANARLAHRDFAAFFSGERWEALRAAGARVQRPLWASTSVKNPDYPDTMYVTELVVEDTVNTMPQSTLDAFADHGEVRGDQVRPHYEDAAAVLQQLGDLGISYDDVVATLEDEGVGKFVTSWQELRETVRGQLQAAS